MKLSEQFEIIRLDEADSTNHIARELLEEFSDKEFVVVTTEYQTAGRGQRGNIWVSEKGENLLFSIACRPTFLEANRQFLLSQAISLSIKETLDHYVRQNCIKWPNDIYHGTKKMGGILIENDLEGKYISHCVIGVGLNVNQANFPTNLPNPTSLILTTRHDNDRDVILTRILSRFEYHYRSIQKNETELLTHKYHYALLWKTGYHPYEDANGRFSARIIEIEPDGHIVLKDSKKEIRRYAFKELTFLID